MKMLKVTVALWGTFNALRMCTAHICSCWPWCGSGCVAEW